MALYPEPDRNCPLCPRLVAFRQNWRKLEPNWFNAPVPPFYAKELEQTRLLIIGLAPGLRGANRTGRPFTGDYAGKLLYETLAKYGFSEGIFAEHPQDGLRLKDSMIINALRCVPPENKPLTSEVNNCRRFLSPYLQHLPKLQAVLTLGMVAHNSTIRALGHKPSQYKFHHGKVFDIAKLKIFASYHCSRYNTSTRRLTREMFEEILRKIALFLGHS